MQIMVRQAATFVCAYLSNVLGADDMFLAPLNECSIMKTKRELIMILLLP